MIAEPQPCPKLVGLARWQKARIHGRYRYNPPMAEFLTIHPDNPQPRLIRHAANVLRANGLVVYPTDSSYALGCALTSKSGAERIKRIREADRHHQLTLVCSDLSSIGVYTRSDNWAYRLIRSLTPGPYTLILKATREVPARLRHKRRKAVGIRVPGNPICQALLTELGAPVLSSTLIMPGDDMPLNSPAEILDRLGDNVDLIVDGGLCPAEPTTVLDLTGAAPVLLREGRGSVESLLL